MLKSIVRGVAAIYTGGASEAFYQAYENEKRDKEQDKINAQNAAMQKEFAQRGIQWKVDDARRAGVHPLAALGAQTHSPSVAMNTRKPDDFDLAQTVLTKKTMEGLDAENQLKLAQAKSINQETEQRKIGRPLYVPVYDQKTGKTIQFIDPELAESLDSTGANIFNLRGMMMEDKENEKQRKERIKKYRKAVKAGKYKFKEVKVRVPDGTGGYKTVIHKKRVQ